MGTLALILSIIGSLNWGLVGIFKFDLVAWIFGGQTATVSRIIYTLVGLAGLWCISLLFRRHTLADAQDALSGSSEKRTSLSCRAFPFENQKPARCKVERPEQRAGFSYHTAAERRLSINGRGQCR